MTNILGLLEFKLFTSTAVFHESTVAGLRAYGFTDTADFVELIINLWKISNVKSNNKGV